MHTQCIFKRRNNMPKFSLRESTSNPKWYTSYKYRQFTGYLNRTLKTYADRFGTRSETYQKLASDIEHWLPANNGTMKNGVRQISKPVSLQKEGISLEFLHSVVNSIPNYSELKQEYEEDFNRQSEVTNIEDYINLMNSLEKNFEDVASKVYEIEHDTSRPDEIREQAGGYHQMILENRPKSYSELFDMIKFVEQHY